MQGKHNGDENSNNSDSSRGMGSIESQGQATRNQQIRIDSDVGTRGDYGTASDDRYQSEGNIGKILSQLSDLENAFLAYVHGHQDRLETRLKESKAQEERFLDGAVRLREDILRMLAKSEEENNHQ